MNPKRSKRVEITLTLIVPKAADAENTARKVRKLKRVAGHRVSYATTPEYNGWKNHATWCVHLHLTNDESTQRWCESQAKAAKKVAPENDSVVHGVWTVKQAAVFILAALLKNEVSDKMSESTDGDSMAGDLMNSILEDVDWDEIAESFLEE